MNAAVKRGVIIALLAAGGVLAIVVMETGSASAPFIRTMGSGGSSTVPYTVEMSPMGTVRFDHVPRRIVTQDANYNDIMVALGQGDKLIATGFRGNSYDGFYDALGVKSGYNAASLKILSPGGGILFDKELLYALHADVHHIDPVVLASTKGWSQSDVEEVARNVGPFFANRYSRDASYNGNQPYKYYSLWELSDKVAQVYRESPRIEGLRAVYDEMMRNISSKLPPIEKRARVGLVLYSGSTARFTPYSIGRGGFGQAQYRDAGARDAFASIAQSTYGGEGNRGTLLDAEGLLAFDPDVLIVPFAIYPGDGATSRGAFDPLLGLKDDPVIGRLSAFRKGRVYPGGTPLQGPVFYLFQIEMAAKQIYPEIFGTYRNDQRYPAAEQLFDRNRVATILRGEAR
jgi:iron complex transport system substrate-binding protein